MKSKRCFYVNLSLYNIGNMKKIKTHIFERYVYCADIHGSPLFESFVDHFHDWKTKFYILWDIFDRGDESFEVIEKIIKMHKEWYMDMILWNHDLFFMIWVGLHPISSSVIKNISTSFAWQEKEIYGIFEAFYGQLIWNGWKNTVRSLKEWYWDEYTKKLDEIIDFLWTHFSLYHIDELWNLLVHGWVPILDDGSIVWEEIDGEFYSWIDYVVKTNDLMKEFDISTLEKLAAIHHRYAAKIYKWMEMRWIIVDEEMSEAQKNSHWKYFTPTWYANVRYEWESGNILKSLRWELDRKWLKRLLVWHWSSEEESFSNLDDEYAQKYYDTVIRLERCHIPMCYETDPDYWFKKPIYGNFGYCVMDGNNELVEIGDVRDIVKISLI